MRKIRKLLRNSIIGKIVKFIWKTIKLIIELILLAIAITIIVQKVTNNKSGFLGYRIFNVATGSMIPQYNIGDIIISKATPPSKIKVGDSIVYLGKVGDFKNRIVTHAVIQIEQDEAGKYLFHTKGIAAELEDPIVHEDQVYGVVVESNKVLTFVCKIIASPYGLYFIIIVPILIYAFSQFMKIQEKSVKYEKEEENSKIEKESKSAKKLATEKAPETENELETQEKSELQDNSNEKAEDMASKEDINKNNNT